MKGKSRREIRDQKGPHFFLNHSMFSFIFYLPLIFLIYIFEDEISLILSCCIILSIFKSSDKCYLNSLHIEKG